LQKEHKKAKDSPWLSILLVGKINVSYRDIMNIAKKATAKDARRTIIPNLENLLSKRLASILFMIYYFLK